MGFVRAFWPTMKTLTRFNVQLGASSPRFVHMYVCMCGHASHCSFAMFGDLLHIQLLERIYYFDFLFLPCQLQPCFALWTNVASCILLFLLLGFLCFCSIFLFCSPHYICLAN